MSNTTTFHDAREVAEILRVCTKTVYREIRRGNLRSTKIGNRIRISSGAIAEWSGDQIANDRDRAFA